MENSDIDLYDDIFVQNKENNYDESDLDDLYGNIHNPEAAETAVQKLMTLTKDHEKLQSQFGTLKSQVSILKNLNTELSTKNKNLEKNFKELIETARTEINRKNDQIKNLRSELDNILFKRAARNINARELEALWEKHKIPEEPFAKLPTQARLKQQQMVGNPDVNVANRQFVAKKRKIEADPSPSQGQENPAKKLKTFDDSVVKKSAPPPVKDTVVINMDMSDISKYVKERKKKEKSAVIVKPVPQESSYKVNSKVPAQEETKHLKKEEPIKRVEEQIKRAEAPIKKPIERSELSKTTEKTEEKAESCDDGPEGRVTRARGSSGGRSKLRNKSGTTSSSSFRKPDPSPSSEKKTENKVNNLGPTPSVRVSNETKQESIDKNKKPAEEEGQEEDILEIGNTETFDDLDFEPYDTEAGGSVTFKSLSTNFSIPKKSNDSKKTEKFTVVKKDAKGILKQDNSTKSVVNNKIDVKGSVSTRRRSRSKGRNEEKKPRSRERVRRKSGSSERDRRKSVERSRRKSGSGERDRRKSVERSRRQSGSGERDRRRSAERVRRKSGSGERDRERRRSGERGRRRSRSRSRNKRAERSPVRRKRSNSRDKLRKERRRRSGSRKRAGSPSSGNKGKEVNKKLTRRSQSLSPTRLKNGEENLNLHDIDIEDDMSLDALEKIKSQIRDKMGLDDNLEPVRRDDETEEGEVSDSDAEEKEAKIVDLRKKLKNKFPKEDNIASSSTTSTER